MRVRVVMLGKWNEAEETGRRKGGKKGGMIGEKGKGIRG